MVVVETKIVVVNGLSLYNAIVGLQWIHRMKVVLYTASRIRLAIMPSQSSYVTAIESKVISEQTLLS